MVNSSVSLEQARRSSARTQRDNTEQARRGDPGAEGSQPEGLKMTDRGPAPKAPNRNATGRDGADGLPEAEQMDWRLRSLWTQRGSAWRREMKHLPREPFVVPLPAEQQTPDPEESEGSAAHAAVHRCPALCRASATSHGQYLVWQQKSI